ncbi:hypothetical protein BZA77DRAFT_149261 [Pyronema omphalodes]|nr:hypothetical protein BZA77DRAFT_149261 [Pyronema omphalodes]
MHCICTVPMVPVQRTPRSRSPFLIRLHAYSQSASGRFDGLPKIDRICVRQLVGEMMLNSGWLITTVGCIFGWLKHPCHRKHVQRPDTDVSDFDTDTCTTPSRTPKSVRPNKGSTPQPGKKDPELLFYLRIPARVNAYSHVAPLNRRYNGPVTYRTGIAKKNKICCLANVSRSKYTSSLSLFLITWLSFTDLCTVRWISICIQFGWVLLGKNQGCQTSNDHLREPV